LAKSPLRAALLALGLGGCLVPMPLEEEPEAQNLPPYLDSGQSRITPGSDAVIDYDPADGQTLSFSIEGVFDPNPEDRIFWRAFVDYRPPLSFGIRAQNNLGLQPGPDARITVRLDPCNEFFGDTLVPVEVIVADRPFLSSDEEPDQTDTPNQNLPTGAGSFTLTWFVRLDRKLCP
jgi:hypothetical protein